MDALTFLNGHVPLFAGASTSELTELAVSSALLKLVPGQIALRAGTTVGELGVVATGGVEVHARVPGKGLALVGRLGPGEVFGEASILEETVAGATVRAGEAGAIVLLIPEGPFRGLLAANADVAARVRALIESRRSPPPAA
ncbi:MAG TPA: cyclic nucleotide-binding domain-containing protein [Elusimicrobiota bacterium]|jgi:CRP-like cAMP-binding protein|nr:cyclic nucleotide-binding domain-containing protein [Elusimicrobiota bacterium]